MVAWYSFKINSFTILFHIVKSLTQRKTKIKILRGEQHNSSPPDEIGEDGKQEKEGFSLKKQWILRTTWW